MSSSQCSSIKIRNNINYGSTEWCSTICRICLQQEEYEMRSIFDKDEMGNSLLLFEKIMECSSVQIIKGSNLPEQICKRCVADLEIAYRFRKNCEHSDTILKSFDIKTTALKKPSNNEKILNNDHETNENNNNLIIKNSNNKEIFQFKPPIGLNVKRTVVVRDSKTTLNNTGNNNMKMDKQNKIKPIKSLEKNDYQLSNIESISVYDLDSNVKDIDNDNDKIDIIDNIVDDSCDPIDYDNTINLVTSSGYSHNHQDLDGDDITVLGNIEMLDCVDETEDDSNANDDDAISSNYNGNDHDSENEDDNENDIIYEYDSFQKGYVFTSPDANKESNYQTESIKDIKLSLPENYYIENINEDPPQQQFIDESTFEISLIRPLKKNGNNRKSNNRKITSTTIKHDDDDGDDDSDDDDGKKTIKFDKLKSSMIRIKPKKKPKQCDICGNFYKYQHELTSHMRRHNNVKPYVCGICDRSFVIKFELSRHMRTHTGAKPYTCRYCDRKYSDFGNRIKHERSHTGERPYECLTCHKRFAYSHVLLSHNLTHTGEKKFFCEQCDRRFTKGHHLKAHLRTHENQLLRANEKLLKQQEFTVEREILDRVRKETAKATKELEKSMMFMKKQQHKEEQQRQRQRQQQSANNDYCYLLPQNDQSVTYKNVLSIIEEASKKIQIKNEMDAFVVETIDDNEYHNQNDEQEMNDYTNQNIYHYDDDGDEEEKDHKLMIMADVSVDDEQQNYEQEFVIKGENGVSYLKRGDTLIPVDSLINGNTNEENDLKIDYDDGDVDDNKNTIEYIQQQPDIYNHHTDVNLNPGVNEVKNLYVDDYGNVTIQSGILINP